MTTLVIIAKECLPGRVKTRLHPALSFEQAAEVAAASLDDTFAALAQLPADRRILAFDGIVPPEGSEPYDVIPQSRGGLDERLAAVFDSAEGPTLLVGMDTPQLRAEDLAPFFPWPEDGEEVGADFVFGPAVDGGFWCLGMREPRGDLIRGVPMSRDDTGVQQLRRLCATGGDIRMLPPLIDVDTIVEARAVAALAPDTRFAHALRGMQLAGAGS
jgi:glycosyltransferase A (GT-A) superfamily protein (DUF2064 family)